MATTPQVILDKSYPIYTTLQAWWFGNSNPAYQWQVYYMGGKAFSFLSSFLM